MLVGSETSSSGSDSEHQRQVYNISAQPGDHSVSVMPTDKLRGNFRTSDLFDSNHNLTISPTSHNHHLHQRCPRSLPLAKVKDSVVASLESTTSHQVSQKTTSWRSTSAIPSMRSVHHCLRSVKNLVIQLDHSFYKIPGSVQNLGSYLH